MTTLQNRLYQFFFSMALLVPFSVFCAAQTSDNVDAVAENVAEGAALVANTHLRLPNNVGNSLNCTSCHLDGGTKSKAASWIGVWSAYPSYSARSGRIISLQTRINDCFQRSMNGKPLDEKSAEMHDILAYMRWLSKDESNSTREVTRGFVHIDRKLVPDPQKGQRIYATNCASCHGANGLGGVGANQSGIAAPPLWGPNSFNDGAGMARTYTAAAFVKHNMPLGKGDSLSDQEAVDVAAYFTHQSRPAFAGQSKDWPSGGRPDDARN